MPAHRGYQRKCHPPHRYLLPCRVHHNNNPVEVGVGGNTWDPEGAVRSQVDSTLAAEERLRNELREEEIECMELARAWGREDPGRDRRLDGQVADMKGGSRICHSLRRVEMRYEKRWHKETEVCVELMHEAENIRGFGLDRR